MPNTSPQPRRKRIGKAAGLERTIKVHGKSDRPEARPAVYLQPPALDRVLRQPRFDGDQGTAQIVRRTPFNRYRKHGPRLACAGAVIRCE